ncbi:MAG: thiol oxidoreductase [Hyphomicrobiaceae bacterium]|nr:thiol oxidoreductase [Hyphomicrobiaceae bacterium]
MAEPSRFTVLGVALCLLLSVPAARAADATQVTLREPAARSLAMEPDAPPVPTSPKAANPQAHRSAGSIGLQRNDAAPRRAPLGGSAGAGSADGAPYAPLPWLTGAPLAQFVVGRAIFMADWIAAPDVSDGADGLGPLYNAASCAACHPGAGRAGESAAGALGSGADGALGRGAASRPARVLRLSRPRALTDSAAGKPGTSAVTPVVPDPVYGLQLQDRAIAGYAAEGRLEIGSEESVVSYADGQSVTLKRPLPGIAAPAYGAPQAGLMLSLRRTPDIAGIGLVAAIDAADILAGADPDDRDGDGISGRAGGIASGGDVASLARFGWKASVASLAAQTSNALVLDMGLSSPGVARAYGDCTVHQTACRTAPDGRSPAKGGHEVSGEEIALLVAFLDGLDAPAAGATAINSAGRRIFHGIGCAACHRPAFTTGVHPGRPGLTGRRVQLYSDLILHDMGAGLADGGPEGVASAREWRTTPLWGLGRRVAGLTRDDAVGLLHDGRAASVAEAILWHGGEAWPARERFRQLSSADRTALLDFLEGL